jgi:hypothetical protein
MRTADVLSLQRAVGNQAAQTAIIQRKLGFEIEMLALVDIGGRPLPEKIPLGKYGTQGIELTVDHNSQVEAPTPEETQAAPAQTIPTSKGPLTLGRYDIPEQHETRVVPQGNAADARANLVFDQLTAENWQVAASNLQLVVSASEVGLFGKMLKDYRFQVEQWDATRARARLNQMRALLTGWHTALQNELQQPQLVGVGANQSPTEQMRRPRVQIAAPAVPKLLQEVQQHFTAWTQPNLANPPQLDRQYRVAGSASTPPSEWTKEHPVEQFMGGNTYHSILEVVTRAYPAESPQGAADVITAMSEAAQLATAIEAQTGRFQQRVLLSTTGASVANAQDTWIGNRAARNDQTTDASIQATFAVDLAQIPSLFTSAIPKKPGALFGLKHQADEPSGYDWARRANTDASKSPTLATQIIAAEDKASAVADLPNLRGLLTLICQYLLMGKYFYAAGDALDKNLVPLLSRTDLASLFRDQVPGSFAGPTGEKAWVHEHWPSLREKIVHETGRRGDAMLFEHPQQPRLPGRRPPLDLAVRTFVDNVFRQSEDGVTRHLDEGLFKMMSAEEVHPEGSKREHESRKGPVFELRGMVPPDMLQSELLIPDRIPKERWMAMGKYFASLLTALHSRTETTDVNLQPVLSGGRDLFSHLREMKF